ncbi:MULTISPECIES: PAS domain-containing protein [unclassified Microbacterium]|uniref:PAS domain-containing protein n=1 Tax=unclassified Microbacterium TaxID=2609290 RepID=UPI0012FB3246|nr:PAS domain-containing protein [Microbacterium sp. MAH-37]MVQ40812.1 PAS domain-containing protein [Microbacterium sp. MAH-37]
MTKTHASKMTLRVQLLLLQAAIVCLVTLIAGITAGFVQWGTIRDAYEDRMMAVSQSIASMPAVVGAFDDADPSETIQPLAEAIRKASDLTYVVVANADGIRYSHPDPEKIGHHVSTDASVPLSGRIYTGTQTGTLGTTWRVKVPIFQDGAVIGTASVGILESHGQAEFFGTLAWIIGAMLAAVLLGLFGSAWVAALIRRRIQGLEPDEISALVRNQETTLHGLSEGVITVDAHGVITLANDAAARFLDTDAAALTGSRVEDVLGAELIEVLREGEDAGRPVILGARVLVARSTGARDGGAAVDATLLLRDHTELHDVVQRVEAADAIIAFRQRAGLPKGLSAETLERVASALAAHPDCSASELGEVLQISRVSTRRYLEHLASTGRAVRSLDYSTRGRPGSRYRIHDSATGPIETASQYVRH